MPNEHDLALQDLRQAVDKINRERYPADPPDTALTLAAEYSDTEYLLARARLAEAECQAARLYLPWMAPQYAAPPKEALLRIKAVCSHWPDLYESLLAVLATHPSVPRDHLARAIKKFRADAATFSVEDLTGMLTAAWNGGRQGFDAVLRTRKNQERKASSGGFPWGVP